MVYHVKIYFGSLLFVWAGIVQRSAKRSLALSHRLCHRSTLRRPYSTKQSGSHLFHILLPHNTSILSQAISSAVCLLPSSSHWNPFHLVVSSLVCPLWQLTQHCPQASRSILRFQDSHSPHPSSQSSTNNMPITTQTPRPPSQVSW